MVTILVISKSMFNTIHMADTVTSNEWRVDDPPAVITVSIAV